MEFLTSADAFMDRLEDDYRSAERRALLQAMTFEGDAAGERGAQALEASNAADRRLLFDAYSLVVVSDRWAIDPVHARSGIVREEREETLAMMRRLQTHDVGVRILNPLGRLGSHFPLRNHKKLAVADNTLYLGGINFSDHNFAWRDMMVRIEHADLADWLSGDFDRAWTGTPEHGIYEDGTLRLDALAGVGNPARWSFLKEAIDAATTAITVVSPYITFPFIGWLGDARKRGVNVRILTPGGNNKQTVQEYLLWEAATHDIEVLLYPGMSHLKAMRIDDDTLIVGSSNFDFVSYASQAEYVLTSTDPEDSRRFDREILNVDLASATPATQSVSSWRARSRKATLQIAQAATTFATRFPPKRWVQELQ